MIVNKEKGGEEEEIISKMLDSLRGEEGVSCMERVTWKLTLSYVK